MRHAPAIGALLLLLCGPAPSVRADPGDALDTGGGGVAVRYVRHARELLEQGHMTEAILYCDRAIALLPNYIRAHFDRGRALLASGQYDAAIAAFTTVIAAHPEYPMVYGYRGEAYLLARKPEAAIQQFNLAMTALTGIHSRMAANIFAQRSLAFEMLGQSDKALADFQDAVRNVSGDIKDFTVFDNSCYSAAVIGLVDAAMDSCDEAIARHSRNMSVYDSRGLAYLKRGAFDRAIADYTQALYYRPELSTSLYGRGIAKRAKGDAAGGAADLAAATASEPHIADIMTRLGVSSAGIAKSAAHG